MSGDHLHLVFLSIQQFIYSRNISLFIFMGPVRCSIVNFFLLLATPQSLGDGTLTNSVSTIIHHTMVEEEKDLLLDN